MQIALGKSDSDELLPNLSLLSKNLKGQDTGSASNSNTVGLMFTTLPIEKVLEYFAEYSRKSFARPGQRITKTAFTSTDPSTTSSPDSDDNAPIVLKKGPLVRHGLPMPNNMEPQLRKLGLPTELDQGVLCLRQDYTVCAPGSILTPDQAHILVRARHSKRVVITMTRPGCKNKTLISQQS